MTRSAREVAEVARLLELGLTATEVSRRTSIPRSTVQDWKHGRRGGRGSRSECPDCFDWTELAASDYAYLLGMYLGDGCISTHPRTYRLRISLDAAYPNIVARCCAAIPRVLQGKRPWIRNDPRGRCVEVSTYSRHWPCLIPQHGPGRKHLRRIELVPWQEELLGLSRLTREAFVRGLIHSDGTRVVATERKGDYVRRAPRYQFSNLSEDIKKLFCGSCDALGVHWTRPSPVHVAIYRLESVAILDEFIGPKS